MTAPQAKQQGILFNAATIQDAVSGSAVYTLDPNQNQANLIANLLAAPAASIAWTIAEVDPIDLATVIGSTASGTQSTQSKLVLSIPMTGRCLLVSWVNTGISTKVNASVFGGVIITNPLLLPPGSHTAITPSDSTDVTAIASIGLLVTATGGGTSLVVRGKTTNSTSVTITVVAGQYVYGQFSRVMAATTATVVGLAP